MINVIVFAITRVIASIINYTATTDKINILNVIIFAMTRASASTR